jgi:O-antigen/teichoic acid export membrane protein
MNLLNQFIRRVSDNNVLREGMVVASAQVGSAVVTFFTLTALTRHLPAAAYGELALSMTAVSVVQALFAQGIILGVSRVYHQANAAGEAWAFRRAVQMHLAELCLAMLALTVAGALIAHTFGFIAQVSIFIAVGMLSIAGTIDGTLVAYQATRRHRMFVAVHEISGPILRLGCALIALACFGRSAVSVLTGFTAAAAISSAAQLAVVALQVRGTARVDRAGSRAKWRLQIIRFALPVTIVGVSNSVLVAADRWVLGSFLAPAALGSFAAVQQLARFPVTMSATIASRTLDPIAFAKASRGTTARQEALHSYRRLCKLNLMATVLIAVLAGSLQDAIATRVLPQEYRSASYLLPIIVIASGLFEANRALTGCYLIYSQQAALAIQNVLFTILFVPMIWLGTTLFGSLGAVAFGTVCLAIRLTWTHFDISARIERHS